MIREYAYEMMNTVTRGARREADRQRRVVMPVGDELAKGRLGAVRRGRQAVCAEPDPREHRDERDAVKRVLRMDVLGRAEKQRADLLRHRKAYALRERSLAPLVRAIVDSRRRGPTLRIRHFAHSDFRCRSSLTRSSA